jgi:hypothetical protein
MKLQVMHKGQPTPRSDVTQFQEATQFHIYKIQSEELSKLYYSIGLFEAPVRPTVNKSDCHSAQTSAMLVLVRRMSE